MKKKIFLWVLTIVMVFSSMTIAAYAENGTTETKEYPNYAALLTVNNPDCKYADDLVVKLNLTVGENKFDIPLEYSKEYGGYYAEGIWPELDGVINGQQTDGFGAAITVEGGDQNHEFAAGDVKYEKITMETIKEEVDSLANTLIYELWKEFNDNEEYMDALATLFGGEITVDDNENVYIDKQAVTFDDLLKVCKEYSDELEMTEEDLAAIKEYEDMMTAMENGDYAGQLYFEAEVKCDCPEMVEYTIYHEYYDAKGKFVGQEVSTMKAEAGSVVKVDDIKLSEKYEGKNYKFEGVYLLDPQTEEINYDNPVDEYTVADGLEVAVKYVSTESASGGAGTVSAAGGNGNSPDTGDNMNVLPFAVIMALAAAGAVAAVRRRA